MKIIIVMNSIKIIIVMKLADKEAIFVKKMHIAFIAVFLILLTSCDPRSRMTENELNELYDSFKNTIQDESIWTDNYIIIANESSALMQKSDSQYINVDSIFETLELSNVFNQCKNYFKDVFPNSDKDSYELWDGWNTAASVKFFTVKTNFDLMIEGETVSFSSFKVSMYDDGRLELDIEQNLENATDKVKICFNVTEQWEDNLIYRYRIVWK